MNFQQLKRLNTKIKTIIEDFTESNRMKQLKEQLENIEEELKEYIEENDLEGIDHCKWLIEEVKKDIERERLNPEEEEETFKTFDDIERQFIREKTQELLKNNETYKINDDCYHDYNRAYHKSDNEKYKIQADKFKKENDKIEYEAEDEATIMFWDLYHSNDWNEYYLIKSGKRDYLNRIQRQETLKTVYEKLNNVVENYQTQQQTLTIEDYKTFSDLWNKYIDEPLTIDFKPINAKYNNQQIEIYKINVAGSIHKKRIQCVDISGKFIDKQNVYIKFLTVEHVEKFDIMTDKNGVKYEVYKTEVEGSEFIGRKSGLSNETGKKRDYKNKYFKRID